MALLERVLGGEDEPSAELVPTSLVVRASSAPPRPDDGVVAGSAGFSVRP
jgi:hypothetical protein